MRKPLKKTATNPVTKVNSLSSPIFILHKAPPRLVKSANPNPER